jgi:hypothetical protein
MRIRSQRETFALRLAAPFKPSSDPYYFRGYDYDPREDSTDPDEDLATAWIVGEGMDRRKPHIQRGAEQGPAGPDEHLTPTERWMRDVGHQFATRIHQSDPTAEHLYRGMTVPQAYLTQLAKTRSMRLPLSSFTVESDTANDYASPDPERGDSPRRGSGLLMRLAPGAKAVPLLDEHITHGDFDVSDLHRMTPQEQKEMGGYGDLPMLADIKQRSVPKPFGMS